MSEPTGSEQATRRTVTARRMRPVDHAHSEYRRDRSEESREAFIAEMAREDELRPPPTSDELALLLDFAISLEGATREEVDAAFEELRGTLTARATALAELDPPR